MLQNALSIDTHWAVYGNGSVGAPTGVRESVFQTQSNSYQGAVLSLGNSLCNGMAC